MKELSIEEKAKRYDEALERANELNYVSDKDSLQHKTVEYIFPELKENYSSELKESERIRKVLVDYFKSYKEQEECGIKTFYGIPTDNIIAWLEKQGNINPTEDELKALRIAAYEPTKNWSEKLQSLYEKLTNCEQGEQKPVFEMKTPEESLGIDSDTYNKIVDECIYGEQKPACSEEDEVKINRIVACLENLNVADNDILLKDVDWLKSLKDRVGCEVNCTTKQQWKPSDEQIEILDMVLTNASMDDNIARILRELREQLKKLKE